jgi:putative FmdB family regulatory protein
MEAIQKISDEPLKDCPECKQETLRKLVSAAAFKLTGTGWYETDFKHNDSKAREHKKAANNGKNQDTTKEAKGKESGNSGKKSESKAEKPKKKESVAESSK